MYMYTFFVYSSNFFHLNFLFQAFLAVHFFFASLLQFNFVCFVFSLSYHQSICNTFCCYCSCRVSILFGFFSFSLTALGSFNGIRIFIEPMSFNARFTQLWYLVCIFCFKVSEIYKKFLFTLIFHVYDLDAGSTLL